MTEADLKALVKRAIEAVEHQKQGETENSSTQDEQGTGSEPEKAKPLPTRLLTEEDALAVGYKPGEAYFVPEELSVGPDPSYYGWEDVTDPAVFQENSDGNETGDAGEAETTQSTESPGSEPEVVGIAGENSAPDMPNAVSQKNGESEEHDVPADAVPADEPVPDTMPEPAGISASSSDVPAEHGGVAPLSEENISPRAGEPAGDKDKRPSRTWIGAPMYTTAEVKKEAGDKTEKTAANPQGITSPEASLPSSSEKEKKTAGNREEDSQTSSKTGGTAKPFDLESFLPSRHPKLPKKGADSNDDAGTGEKKKSSSRGSSKGAKTAKAAKTVTNPETILRDMFARMKEQFAVQEGPWLEDVRPDRYGVRCSGRKFLADAEKAGVVAPELLLVSIVGRAQKAPVLAWDASTKEFIYKNRP